MAWAGHEVNAHGVVEAYAGLIDGVVADEPVEDLPVLRTDTRMDTPKERRRLAEETLRFARGLGG
jgi:hypothetical protein